MVRSKIVEKHQSVVLKAFFAHKSKGQYVRILFENVKKLPQIINRMLRKISFSCYYLKCVAEIFIQVSMLTS